jgi:hypothetical protein
MRQNALCAGPGSRRPHRHQRLRCGSRSGHPEPDISSPRTALLLCRLVILYDPTPNTTDYVSASAANRQGRAALSHGHDGQLDLEERSNPDACASRYWICQIFAEDDSTLNGRHTISDSRAARCTGIRNTCEAQVPRILLRR